jgi:ribosomal protein S18 acetylase RimI-like enzyme
MITYRDYQETDWASVCNIHDHTRPDELKGSCDPRAFIPIEKDPEVEVLKRSQKFVAGDGEQVVGFVAVDEKYISFLYIDPDYFGQGIGRKLLQMGIEAAGPGAWTIVLHNNHPAIRLYQSEAFKEVHRFDSDNAGYPCTYLRMERE